MNGTARAVCLGCLALALPTGALGIGLATVGLNTLGGFAMCVAGFMLVLTVILSVHDMSKTAKRDENDVELLRRMATDGTFAEKAREAGIHIVLRKTT